MEFIIRAAFRTDIPFMHAVRTRVRENRLSDPGRVTEASYLPYIAAGSCWVAETGAGIAGFAALDVREGAIWALFVDPSAEGIGVGRALHGRMLEWALERGLRCLSLHTDDGSRAAHFYKRAGWKRMSTTLEGEVLFQKMLAS
jgi:GNAT superfamily N-acetyltransferase